MAEKEANGHFLMQIMSSIEEAGQVLKEAHDKQDSLRFNKAKKIILNLQNKLEEEVGNAGRFSN